MDEEAVRAEILRLVGAAADGADRAQRYALNASDGGDPNVLLVVENLAGTWQAIDSADKLLRAIWARPKELKVVPFPAA